MARLPAVEKAAPPPFTATTGRSFTEFTVTLNVVEAVSLPPFAVPPLSCTVTVITAVPWAFATGVYFSEPVADGEL